MVATPQKMPFPSTNGALLSVPDLSRVLADGAVAREFSGPGRIGDGFARPLFRVGAIVAPSRVPIVKAPFIMNFMLLVPQAS